MDEASTLDMWEVWRAAEHVTRTAEFKDKT
jgi:hypothetical protein